MSKGGVAVAAAVIVAAAVVAVAVLVSGRGEGRGDASPGPATVTFTPVADTYVDKRTPATNYGTSPLLGADGSPVKRMFLRFGVSGLTGTVSSARLRVHTGDVPGSGSDDGGTFRSTSDHTWSETGVTWRNQPALDGAALGSIGAVRRGEWYEIDVTSYVRGDGAFGFGVTSASGNGVDYDSRESGATAPQLVVTTGGPSGTPAPTPSTDDPVLVGAGDIATSGSGDGATAKLLDDIPGTVFTTGDDAYPDGSADDFADFYAPTWGRHKARTRPVPGNHEYRTTGAAGYFGYFGPAAGEPGKGYYSYDLGDWHVVALNSNCSEVGGCDAGSPQEQWLRSDLAASAKPCTIAYWHHPRFTSGANHAPDRSVGPLVRALYDNDAEVVVTGHNHQYERFAPMNPRGGLDEARGIRHFVVGTGGATFYGFGTIQPNSEVRDSDTFGVLKLTLHPGSYTWEFVPQAGKTFTDDGTTSCH
ncbi:CBM96 family carbohydrate-binding protein [Sphaerisporangium aureirubrum]|uniref:DNRLRE domain-containing protein n=1 Tax=Sphaerisporangium aureirubrum TaxID=1544736 RepID=A0ABW1NA06_9ACTN